VTPQKYFPISHTGLRFLFMPPCLYFKVEDHGHTDRTHGVFTALVVVLPKIVQTLRKGRTVCSEFVYLEEAGAEVPAKQGSLYRTANAETVLTLTEVGESLVASIFLTCNFKEFLTLFLLMCSRDRRGFIVGFSLLTKCGNTGISG